MATTTITTVYDPTIDVQEDGEPWPFVIDSATDTVLANDAGDLIAACLIEGYGDLGRDDAGNQQALLARARESVTLAATLQAFQISDRFSDDTAATEAANAAADAAGQARPEPVNYLDTLSEDELTALLGDRDLPLDNVERWEAEIPLVLVATDYSPYTEDSPPSGNVLWIDPSDEIAWLESLSNLGVIRFYIHGDH